MADQVSKADGNTNRTLIGLTTAATPEIRNIAVDGDGRLLTTSSSAGTTSTVSVSSVAAGAVIGISSVATGVLIGLTTAANTVQTVPIAPSTVNLSMVTASYTATAAQSAVVNIPAGRYWSGSIGIAASIATAAASTVLGQAKLSIQITGSTDAIPAPGSIFLQCQALAGPGTATGLTGAQSNNSITTPNFTIFAGSTTAHIATTPTISTGGGATGSVDAFFFGQLLP